MGFPLQAHAKQKPRLRLGSKRLGERPLKDELDLDSTVLELVAKLNPLSS